MGTELAPVSTNLLTPEQEVTCENPKAQSCAAQKCVAQCFGDFSCHALFRCEEIARKTSTLSESTNLNTRIGSNRGKPQSTIKQSTQSIHTHSNGTFTTVFPSTLRNTLVVMTKHNATTPNQSTTQKLLATRNQTPRSTKPVEQATSAKLFKYSSSILKVQTKCI